MDCSVGMFGTGVLVGTANQFKATHDGTTNSDTNGNYHKLGSMIQGGNMDSIQTGGTVITFPIPFPNGIVSVVAMVVNSGGTGGTPYVLEAESISKTGFTLKSDFSGINAHYIAIGY
jgi:hypothetical protein